MNKTEWSREKVKNMLSLYDDKEESIENIALILNIPTEEITKKIDEFSFCISKRETNWTKEELNKLKILIDENKTAKEIAETLLKSYNQIINKIRKLKLRKTQDYNKWNDDEVQKLKTLKKEGKPVKEIAKILNKPIDSVKGKCFALHIHSPPKESPFTDNQIKFIKEEVSKDISWMKLSEQLNCNYYDVWKFCKDNKIISNHSQKLEETKLLKEINKKRCRNCLKILPFENFYTKIASYCKKCDLDEKNQIYHDNRAKTLKDCLKQKWKTTKQTCKRTGIDFSITLNDLLEQLDSQKNLCFYSKHPISFIPSQKETLSIDRVDSNKGYTKGNTVLCCWIVNCMKNKYSIEEIIKWSKLIIENSSHF